MVLKTDQAIETKIQVLDSSGDPATAATVSYTVYDEGDGAFASGSMSHIANGIYSAGWTPDASGEWTFYASCSNPKFHKCVTYFVGKGIEDDFKDKSMYHMDFWSGGDDEIAITDSSQSLNLPNITVASLPSGISIQRVIVMLKIALLKDSSGSDNAISNGSMMLSVDSESDYSSTVPAIDIPDNGWAVDESAERVGDGIKGNTDVKTEITGNGTFYGRFENAQADGGNLLLKDVAWGILVSWKP